MGDRVHTLCENVYHRGAGLMGCSTLDCMFSVVSIGQVL